MEEKIQWYEEILHSDPSSALFFPLARLYLRKEDREKAVEVLQRGIERHPEHVEARLLLSDLLKDMERHQEREALVDEISSLFSRYPSFWSGWAELLRRRGEEDLAAAAAFFGGSLGGSHLTWAGVIEAGLQALSGQGAPSGAQGSQGGAPEDQAPSRGASEEADSERAGQTQVKQAEAAGMSDEPGEPGEAEESEEIIELVDGRDEGDVEYSLDEDQEAEAPSTYRTKTMADILAGQGDFEAALEIYHELLDETTDEGKRSELEERIETVRQKRVEAEQPSEASGTRSEKSGKKALLQRMEKLAERLEARS